MRNKSACLINLIYASDPEENIQLSRHRVDVVADYVIGPHFLNGKVTGEVHNKFF